MLLGQDHGGRLTAGHGHPLPMDTTPEMYPSKVRGGSVTWTGMASCRRGTQDRLLRSTSRRAILAPYTQACCYDRDQALFSTSMLLDAQICSQALFVLQSFNGGRLRQETQQTVPASFRYWRDWV